MDLFCLARSVESGRESTFQNHGSFEFHFPLMRFVFIYNSLFRTQWVDIKRIRVVLLWLKVAKCAA